MKPKQEVNQSDNQRITAKVAELESPPNELARLTSIEAITDEEAKLLLNAHALRTKFSPNIRIEDGWSYSSIHGSLNKTIRSRTGHVRLTSASSKIEGLGIVHQRKAPISKPEMAAPKIQMPPLHPLTSLCRWLSPSAYDRYIYPQVADIYHEYFKAIASGDRRWAIWVVVRGYLTILRPLWAAIIATFQAWSNISKS